MNSESISPQTRFGRLKVLAALREGRAIYICQCDCGKRVNAYASHLKLGHKKSCGCWYRDTRPLNNLQHGHDRREEKTPEYSAFHWARQICRTPTCRDYPRFGGRGIELEFDSFPEFLAAVGPRPGPGYTLRRIDRDGNFSAGNLQWTPPRGWSRRNRAHRETK